MGRTAANSARLRLDIAYDGTDFAGWAVQRDRRTVAGVLGEGLTTLFRASVPMVVAGRTDAGVHAAGQVAHIDVDPAGLQALAPRGSGSEDDAAAGLSGRVGLLRRLSGLMPPDVRVRTITPAPAGFDARFSALRRHYRYRISTAEYGNDPLRRRDVHAVRRPLDTAAMNRAAECLTGLHDFAAYCKPRVGATTIRELQRLTVSEAEKLIAVDVTADAFCHCMVRSLVGALLAVGLHRADEQAPLQFLRERRRTSNTTVAPAHGLTLMAVDYPSPGELSARSLLTRATRPALESRPSAPHPGPWSG